MTRVFVVAPSSLARAGLTALLRESESIEVEGSGADLSALPAQIDVVVADVESGEIPPDWLPVTADGPALLVLVSDPAAFPAGEALRAGARAVLPRDLDAAEIASAVEAVARGFVVLLPDSIHGTVFAQGTRPQEEALTPREIEVLRLLAEGQGNKQIAWKLGISEHTVKFHVAQVMAKLRVGSRTEAVAVGIRQGLVPL